MTVSLGWQRLTLQKPAETEADISADGQLLENWEDVLSVAVSDIRGISGSEKMRDNVQVQAEATHTMMIRWHPTHRVEPGWRLKGRDYYFDIVQATDLDFKQRWTFIQATIGYDDRGRV